MEPVIVAASPHPDVLTPEAVDFIVELDRAFGARRVDLLDRRRRHRATRTGGLDFPAATRAIREDPSWTVEPPPDDLADRRVEIVTPPTPAGAAEALASRARVWVADLASGTSPTWDNVVCGQLVLRNLASTNGPAVMVRPRAWHLPERHLRIGGRPVPAALFDAGLYLFHSGRRRVAAGSGAYFSLSGVESHLEARWWADVFAFARDRLGLPRGTVRATVEIDTVGAAFEIEEILYESREFVTGLAGDRGHYLASLIAERPDVVLPSPVAMTEPFLRAYAQHLVRAAHRRGTHAIGPTAAVVPSRDQVAGRRDLNAVRQDKRREVGDGFDGCRVAHPALVVDCRDVFDQWLGDEPHQIVLRRSAPPVTAADLLEVRFGPVVVGEVELRTTAGAALRYLAAWLDGRGTIVLGGVRADAGTAEVATARLWQWIARGTTTDDGSPITEALVVRMIDEEIGVLADTGSLDVDAARRYWQARALLGELLAERTCPPPLTLAAYLRELDRSSPNASRRPAMSDAMLR